MEDNFDKIIERANEVKEKNLIEKELKTEDSPSREVPDREVEKIVDIKNKAMEIKEQIKKQEGLVFKLGLKKRDTKLREEFESLHQEYKQALNNLEASGFNRESVREKELKINLSRKKEDQKKEIEKLTPLKSRLFQKIKELKSFLKDSLERKEPEESIESQGDFLEKIKTDLEKETIKEEDIIKEPVSDKEEINVLEGNLAGRFRDFDEEQVNKKIQDLENEEEVREETFDTRNIPNEEEARKKYEKIKEKEEDEKEIIEESMDRPNI